MRRRRRLARDPPESRGNDSLAGSRDSRPVHLPGPRRDGAGRRAVRPVAWVREVVRRGRATSGRVAEGRCDPGERGGVSSAASPGDLQGQRDRRSETPVMRRILIIAYHFPPDAAVGALRPLKFAKYLPQFGWEPWVLTVRPEYYESLDRSRLDEVRYPTKVFPTRMLPHPNALYKSVQASCY